MVLRLGALFLASAVVFGCGSGDQAAPAGGKAGKVRDVPFPEKGVAGLKGSLASSPKLTEANLDSYIKYMKGLMALQKGVAADPMATAAKMQNLPKESGFASDAEMQDTVQRVASGLHLILVLAADETGPAAGTAPESYTRNLAEAKKQAVDAGLAEADLRLIHKHIKDIQALAGAAPSR